MLDQPKILGYIDFDVLIGVNSTVKISGNVISDAKIRSYSREYTIKTEDNSEYISIRRSNNTGDTWVTPKRIPLTRELIAFFGLYSGDGSKGTEVPPGSGILKLNNVSFEQREINIIKFSMEQFRYLFGSTIGFNFSLGEDSAIFYSGDYLDLLKNYYGGSIPKTKPLPESALSEKDQKYLKEKRTFQTNNVEEDLSFYFTHKKAMQAILTSKKNEELASANINLSPTDKVTASLRRPFKKGSRNYGKGSRSDSMRINGTNGLGEIFLYILHSIEDSILKNIKTSENNLIKWNGLPNEFGQKINTVDFFKENIYGKINNERPIITEHEDYILGQWSNRSNKVKLAKSFTYSPKLAYVSGLYLAEGTDHDKMISMYRKNVSSLNFSFTSSEDQSLSIVLTQLEEIIKTDNVVHTWKIKVGSQYFAELCSISNKLNIPLLRGGRKGQGKLKTIEVSIAIRDWGIHTCPTMKNYISRFSHVEPTGAGVARIDFSCSSSICKWIFPIFMSTVFSNIVTNPEKFQ